MTRRRPPKGFLPDMRDNRDEDWSQNTVSVVNRSGEGTEVRVDQAGSTIIITNNGVYHAQTNAPPGAIYHQSDCKEKECVQCLLRSADEARSSNKAERIGHGSQGYVYKFLGPDRKKYYVRKDVVMAPVNTAPVTCKLVDESTKYVVTASIEGETNRLFVSGPHFVKLYGIRVHDTNHVTPSRLAEKGVIPLRYEGGGGKTLQFVMECMDMTLEHLQQAARLTEQRVLNRLVVMCEVDAAGSFDPREDEAEPAFKKRYASAASCAAALAVVAASKHDTFSWSVPFYSCHPLGTRRLCGCSAAPQTVLHSPAAPAAGWTGGGPGSPVKQAGSVESTAPKAHHTRADFGVLPECMVLNVFTQVACSFERLAQCSLIHKDIKPSNILLGKNGRVKLGDFGTSKRGKREQDGVSVTTPCGISTRIYKAPELAGMTDALQAQDLSDLAALGDGETEAGELCFGAGSRNGLGAREPGIHITSAADVWSLALTMLVVASPSEQGPWPDNFVGRTDTFFHPTCITSFRVPATLSEEFRHLAARCMCFRPDARPTPKALVKEPILYTCDCKSAKDTPLANSLAKFMRYVICLAAPAEEARRTAVHQELVQAGMPLLDTTGPTEYAQWCDSTLAGLKALFRTRQSPTFITTPLSAQSSQCGNVSFSLSTPRKSPGTASITSPRGHHPTRSLKPGNSAGGGVLASSVPAVASADPAARAVLTLPSHRSYYYMRPPARVAPHRRGHPVNHVSFKPPSGRAGSGVCPASYPEHICDRDAAPAAGRGGASRKRPPQPGLYDDIMTRLANSGWHPPGGGKPRGEVPVVEPVGLTAASVASVRARHPGGGGGLRASRSGAPEAAFPELAKLLKALQKRQEFLGEIEQDQPASPVYFHPDHSPPAQGSPPGYVDDYPSDSDPVVPAVEEKLNASGSSADHKSEKAVQQMDRRFHKRNQPLHRKTSKQASAGALADRLAVISRSNGGKQAAPPAASSPVTPQTPDAAGVCRCIGGQAHRYQQGPHPKHKPSAMAAKGKHAKESRSLFFPFNI
eukprot:gene14281-21905_t